MIRAAARVMYPGLSATVDEIRRDSRDMIRDMLMAALAVSAPTAPTDRASVTEGHEITDAMVERAAVAIWGGNPEYWSSENFHDEMRRDILRAQARRALTSALTTPAMVEGK